MQQSPRDFYERTFWISRLSDNIKSIELADEKFVKNITLIKFFKRKILIGFRKNIVTAHGYFWQTFRLLILLILCYRITKLFKMSCRKSRVASAAFLTRFSYIVSGETKWRLFYSFCHCDMNFYLFIFGVLPSRAHWTTT
jgi:hypothetical protein